MMFDPSSCSRMKAIMNFLTRLWRSEGINWLIDEAQLKVPHSSAPIEKQKLRLIDDNSQYQALSRRSIRFHRSSATEKQDSITSLIGEAKHSTDCGPCAALAS